MSEGANGQPKMQRVYPTVDQVTILFQYDENGHPSLVVQQCRILNVKNGIALANPEVQPLGEAAAAVLIADALKNMALHAINLKDAAVNIARSSAGG